MVPGSIPPSRGLLFSTTINDKAMFWESFLGRFLMVWGSFLDGVGIVFGWFGDRFGIVLGPFLSAGARLPSTLLALAVQSISVFLLASVWGSRAD